MSISFCGLNFSSYPASFSTLASCVLRSWSQTRRKRTKSSTATKKTPTHITIKAVLIALLDVLASVTEDFLSQPFLCFSSSCLRFHNVRCMSSQLSVSLSLWGTHWKSLTLEQKSVEKKTFSGELLNPVFRRMILLSFREWIVSISCKWRFKCVNASNALNSVEEKVNDKITTSLG